MIIGSTGRNGFSAARFSVPGFPFMFFLYTVFHFAIFPVAWFSLHRYYLFHQAFYHLNQAFFNHAIWREAKAIASERLSFLLEFRVFPRSYREILASILFFFLSFWKLFLKLRHISKISSFLFENIRFRNGIFRTTTWFFSKEIRFFLELFIFEREPPRVWVFGLSFRWQVLKRA